MADKPKKKRARKSKKSEPVEATPEAKPRKQPTAKKDGPKSKQQRTKQAGKPKVAKARRIRTRLAPHPDKSAPLEMELAPETTAPARIADAESSESPEPGPGGPDMPAAAEPTELTVSLKYVDAADGKKLWVHGAVMLNGTELGHVSRLRLEASEGKRLPKVECTVGKGAKSKDLAEPATKEAIRQTLDLLAQVPGIKLTSPLRRSK